MSVAKTLMQFDSDTIQPILDEAESALNIIATRHGVRLRRRSSAYGKTNLKPGFEFYLPGAAGGVKKEEDAFQARAAAYGLDPAWLGQQVTINRSVFTIVGLNCKAPANPVQIKRVPDGKEFKTSVQSIKDYFALQTLRTAGK